MATKQQIKSDVVAAMKAKDSDLAGVLRLALAAIASREKEKHYAIAKENPNLSEEELKIQEELSDQEIVDVLASEVKKRRDAIALYEQGGRPELAEGEKKEITVLQKYLPEQLSGEQLRAMVAEAIAATGAKEVKDMGRVMAELSPKTKGRADGAEVSKIVKELLNV